AVAELLEVGAAAAVNRERLVGFVGAAAHILRADGARNQTGKGAGVLRQRQRLDERLVHDRLHPRVDRVDDGRFAGDGHRLSDGAYLQRGIDRRGKARGQDDVLAPGHLESGKREAERVRAGPKLDDFVPSLAVGRRRPRLLDERGTGRLDGHTRQHGAGRVDHRAFDGTALREGENGREHTRCRDGDYPRCLHRFSPLTGEGGREATVLIVVLRVGPPPYAVIVIRVPRGNVTGAAKMYGVSQSVDRFFANSRTFVLPSSPCAETSTDVVAVPMSGRSASSVVSVDSVAS